MQYEGPVKPVASHEEELAHLRAQVEAKERELEKLKQHKPRDEVIREKLASYVKMPGKEVLAPHYELTSQEKEEISLRLDPESDDETMEELRAIMETKGIHNAFSVLARLKSPHLEDDFHRYLIAYINAGLPVKGLREGQPEWKALHMTLYEIQLPELDSDKDTEKQRSFKELVSAMEQFYAGMLAVEETYAGEPQYYTLELAVPAEEAHLRFYASVPNGKRDLFQKQVLAIFPDAVITEQFNDYNVFAQDGYTYGSIGKLARPHALSLKDYGEFDSDPLRSILNAFAKMQNVGEGAAIQIVIRPEPKKYDKAYGRIVKALREGEKPAHAFEISEDLGSEVLREIKGVFRKQSTEGGYVDEALVKSVEAKRSSPIVETNIRILTSSPDDQHARQMLNELEATFNQYENTTGNKLVFTRVKGGAVRSLAKDYSWRLFSHTQKLPLSLKELTTMYHFPPKGVKGTPHLKQARFTQAPAPIDLASKDGVLLGHNSYRGQMSEVWFSEMDRMRHLYLIGQTGTGKTVFMKNLIIQDIKDGKGVCFIDPHGNDVLDVLAAIPPERYEDVIYFDPAYIDRPFGLNMLEYDPSRPEQKTFIVNELFMIFKRLYGDVPESMGPAFEQYFRNATQLVMEHPESGSTMLDIARVLSNAEFRNYKVYHSKNPVINQFWTEIATRAEGDASLANIVPYITNKFDDFTANDFIRPIVGQQNSSFRFREVMDQKKILLVNLSKGRLGERNANLLGLIIVGKLFMAALSRADSPEVDHPPFYLYIDEFQNITTDSIPGILSEARKYKLSLTIAHQFLKQIDEKARNAIFGNVGSMAVFRVGEEDGEFFEKQFAPVFTALDFVNIENFNAYVRLLSKGVPQKPFNIKTLPPEKGNKDQVNDLRELSYLTYGRDRAEIEAHIQKRFLS